MADVAGHLVATLSDGTEVAGRALVAATGAHYRKLPVDRLERYEMAGVYYAATELEARHVRRRTDRRRRRRQLGRAGGDVPGREGLVGVRRRAPRRSSATMSNYLVDRIHHHPRIEVHEGATITALAGEPTLQQVTVTARPSAASVDVDCTALFSFIGAEPNSEWLAGVALDEHGFVLTDRSLRRQPPRRRVARARAPAAAVRDELARAVRRRRPALGLDQARRRRRRRGLGRHPLGPRAPRRRPCAERADGLRPVRDGVPGEGTFAGTPSPAWLPRPER